MKRIHIIAHSMGNWLAVEPSGRPRSAAFAVLAQARRGLPMSPDIDVDVFRTQLDAIGSLNEPITIGVGG